MTKQIENPLTPKLWNPLKIQNKYKIPKIQIPKTKTIITSSEMDINNKHDVITSKPKP